MKKEMNSKSKRKWIMGGVIAFCSVALLSTGFATWIIGTQTTSANGNVTVNVDTVQNAAVKLAVTMNDNAITLADTATDGTHIKASTGDKTKDFSVSFTATITVGADYTGSYDKLSLSLAEADSEAKTLDNKVESGGVSTLLGEKHKAGQTYFDVLTAMSEIALDKTEGDGKGTSNTTSGLNATYTKTGSQHKWSVSFTGDLFGWGTFFGGKGPVEYYTALYNDATVNTDEAALDSAVYDELKAMENKYSGGKTVVLKVALA